MRATEILMEEHKNILKVLDRLEFLIALPLIENLEEVEFIVAFVQEYSDGYHHTKEEDIYFKWISKSSPSLENGPVHCMLSEHTTFRDLTMNAKNALESFKDNGSIKAADAVFGSLEIFTGLLRSHIEKEDGMLYQMAERLDASSECGDKEMMPDFNEVEREFRPKVEKFLVYCQGL